MTLADEEATATGMAATVAARFAIAITAAIRVRCAMPVDEKATAKGRAATGAAVLTLDCIGAVAVPEAGRMRGGTTPVDEEAPATMPPAVGAAATIAANGHTFVVRRRHSVCWQQRLHRPAR